MSVIKITVDDQNLHITDSPKIAAQGVNENYVEFTFSADWDGFGKTAIFYNESDPETVYTSLVDGNGLALIPHEVTASEGRISLGLSGVKDNIVKTSEILTYKIVKGLYVAETSEPSPGIYEQMLAMVGAIQSDQESFISEIEADQDAFKSEIEADQDAFKSEIEASIAEIESETDSSISVIDARVDNFINGTRPGSVTTLWTGSINKSGESATLSENVSAFDFLDIYSIDAETKFIRVPASQTSIQIQSQNMSDDGSSAFLYLWETGVTISGTTASITKCILWSWLNPGTDSPTVTPNAQNGPDITRIDGVKTSDESPAELLDIRVGADGTTYASAGAAVRGQISDLNENLEPLQSRYEADTKPTRIKTVTPIEWTSGYFYNLTTGAYTSSPVMKASPKYDCNVGDVILLDANQGQMLFFNKQGGLSASYVVTEYPTPKPVSIPENTVQFAFNNAGSNAIASSFTRYSEPHELIVKNVIAPAKVLYDSNAFTNKQYVSTVNGFLYEGDNYSSWYCLPFVKVKPSHKYRTETQTQIVFYDANMGFISSILPGGAAANTGVQIEMDFTTPATCEYISINSQSTHEMFFDVDSYEIVGQVINPQKLTGLKVLSFGDSITGNYAFGDNISSFVENFTGAKTYNCGFGGCRMEKLDENGSAAEIAALTNPFAMCELVDQLALPDTDPNKWDAQDTAAATFEASPRYNRIIKFRLGILKNIDLSDIDIVTIAYGTNEIGYDQYDQNDPYNKYTYGGATRYSIEKLFEINPKLRIVLITPIYRHDVSSTGQDSDSYVNSGTGLSMADNINTLKSVGLEYKIPVIDMYHDLGINAENYTAYFGDNDEPDDGTHINSYGRKMFGLRLAGELNRLF